ncbi:MAG TPA: PRC-barrel domain-containing protein [Noviherbaspirillum sp.]|nr:PRC-barrel domain-containing protein [Noviherbaspirillum sp.]
MLHSARNLKGFAVVATDGSIGKIDDVYFDDEKWVIRYVVVDTGGWLTGRKVLLSPMSFRDADWQGRKMMVNLTRDRVRNSPGIDTHKPVSRRQEGALYEYYGYPYYWSGPYAWGYAAMPAVTEQEVFDSPERQHTREAMEQTSDEDMHLRSCADVTGYAIHATDDTLGHVDDFLFDEQDWSIRLVLVDPRDWWPNKDVMVPPERIVHVNWEDGTVDVNMSRAEIESSPEYDPDHPPPSTLQEARAHRPHEGDQQPRL